jgi:hypothetical protein
MTVDRCESRSGLLALRVVGLLDDKDTLPCTPT